MSHLQSSFFATRVIEDVPNYLFVVNHSTGHIEILVQGTDHNNWYRNAGEIKISDEAGLKYPIPVASDRISGAVFKGKNDGEQWISIFFVREDDADDHGNTLFLCEVRGLVTTQNPGIEWEFGKIPAIATHKSAHIVATTSPDGLPSVMIPSIRYHNGKIVVTTMKDHETGDWSMPKYVAIVNGDGSFSSMAE